MSTNSSEEAYLRSSYPFAVIRERLNRHPGPVLDFALGQRREPPPAWLPGLVRDRSDLVLLRRGQKELDRFTEAAASMLGRIYGADVDAGAILPAPSGRAAMSALASSLIAPGDRVLVTEPGYPAFARIAAQRGARIAVAPLDPDRGFAPDLGVLDQSGADRALSLAALNYPNNPTGSTVSPETVQDLRGRLDPGGVIFNDAIYGPLTFDQPPQSMLAGRFGGDGEPAIIELHSLGKLFSLGPLGMAFLVGDADRVVAVRQYSDFAWTQLSSLQVRVATRCLEDWGHVEKLRDSLHQRLAELREVVSELGFECFAAEAGMYLLCRAPGRIAMKPVAGAAEAAERLLEEHGLAVAPWEVPPHGYLRFSAAYRPEDLGALAELGRGSALASP
jgi:aminotransferase